MIFKLSPDEEARLLFDRGWLEGNTLKRPEEQRYSSQSDRQAAAWLQLEALNQHDKKCIKLEELVKGVL